LVFQTKEGKVLFCPGLSADLLAKGIVREIAEV
jgi:hypothetical protein